MNATGTTGPGRVAVIGMACRFPMADTPGELWRNLIGARDCITRFSEEERERAGGIDDLSSSARRVFANGVLNDVELFDAQLFGFSANEATITDPQQRLSLEVAWQCLVDAGLDPRAPGLCVGVFTSSSSSTYLINELLPRRERCLSAGGVPLLIRNDKDHNASLIAYKLGLTGPALNVGCGCSGGLAAVHVGIHSLLTGQSDVALCGASSVLVPQKQGHLAVANGIYSHDGYCRVFDESASGTVGGAGIGFLALKRLDEAIRDGDRVYATILGSAMNNDGHAKAGYTAPSVNQQAAVISMAQAASGVVADTITMIEAHGTGTALGDPIEVQALTRAFSRSTRGRNYCALGSVKSNIGHADVAAGVAGLIKTVLSLRHAQIPPTLHFSRPNPQLQLEESPFYVNTTLRPWEPRQGVRRAGVTSLGMGGTNVHVVLEEFKSPPEPSEWSADCYLFPLSAHTEQALESWGHSLGGYLDGTPVPNAGSLAYTLATRRPAMKVRRAVVAANVAAFQHELAEPAAGTGQRPHFVLVLGDTAAPAPPLPQAWLQHGLAEQVAELETAVCAAGGGHEIVRAQACDAWLRELGLPFDTARGPGELRELLGSAERSEHWHVLDPNGTLTSVSDVVSEAPQGVMLNVLGPRNPGSAALLGALAHAWQSGVNINWRALYAGAARRWIDLPAYPLMRARYWIESTPSDSSSVYEQSLARARECYAEHVGPEHFLSPASVPDLEAGLDMLCRLAFAAAHRGGAHLEVHPRHQRFYESLQARAGNLPVQKGELRPFAESLQARFNSFAGLIDIVCALGETLPENLRDPMSGALAFHRLLEDGSLQRALDTKPPFSNVAACAIAAAGLLADRVKEEGRPLRILEAGAGRLILTQFMEELIRSGRVEYWITDVSPTLVQAAAKVIEMRGLQARTAVVDITRKLVEQCPDAEPFDVILGLNVVHVCPDVDAALANLRNSLAPRGELMLLEATRDPLWATFIWGWSEGWWSFEDRRRSLSPLMSAQAWQAALERLRPSRLAALESEASGGDTGLWVAQFNEPAPGAAPAVSAVAKLLGNRELGPEQWLYKPCFIRQAPPRTIEPAAPGTWIVFEDEAARVTIGGESPLIRVVPGPGYEQLGADSYRVRPTSAADLAALLNTLVPRLQGQPRMLFTWRLDGDARFYSMLALAQAVSQEVTGPSTIAVITRGLYDVTGAEALEASESLVAAVAKILPREHWSCTCRVIDLVEDGVASADTWKLVGQLASATDGLPLAAIRAGQYWTPWYSPVNAQHTGAATQRLRREGTYVIFGGLGGIGFSIARFLAQRYAARLVLASRSADGADPQVAAKVEEIRQLGGECVAFAADVTVPEDVSAALIEAEQCFGAISGVIHSAGEIDEGGVIQGRSLEQTAGKLAAKVTGARALAAGIGSRKLDFLVLFSSIGSVLYKLKFGEVAYVAGNDFLAAFAHALARQAPYFVQVIQWTDWDSAGMWSRARASLQNIYAAEPGQENHLTRDLLHALTQEQGTSTFAHALSTGEPHVLVSLQPLEALLRDHDRYQPEDYGQYLNQLGLTRRTPEQPVPAAEPDDAGEKDIRVLRSIWEEVIGCKVEPDSDFFELGGDSLLALRVISRVAEEYKVSLPLNAFFSSSTLRDMYVFVDNLRWAGAEREVV